ncbi:MAG TPA: hypothetical protein VF271_07150 [Rhodanobacteraceae bacterium]
MSKFRALIVAGLGMALIAPCAMAAQHTPAKTGSASSQVAKDVTAVQQKLATQKTQNDKLRQQVQDLTRQQQADQQQLQQRDATIAKLQQQLKQLQKRSGNGH